MMPRWWVVICLLAISSTARSEGMLNKLLAPGPLIEGHKNLEASECLQCHTVGEGVPDAKCLKCHKAIAELRQKKESYHGRSDKACLKCHRDHKGRSFAIIDFDHKQFDHLQTGFSLAGKHMALSCAACHERKGQKKKSYLGLAQACSSCHAAKSKHNFVGALAKKDCSSCHSSELWTPAPHFDHERDARYPLLGKHQRAACSKCHKPESPGGEVAYTLPAARKSGCAACHDNVHRQAKAKSFQKPCDSCHNQEQWKDVAFNHAEVTGFKLSGKHQSIACSGCHKGAMEAQRRRPLTGDRPPKECIGCHKDPHFFGQFVSKRLGPLSACKVCHNEQAWKQGLSFSHQADTVFALTGKHHGLGCRKCHGKQGGQESLPAWIYVFPQLEEKSCATCHKNHHERTFSAELLRKPCTSCHSTQGWKGSELAMGKDFDHDRNTKFALSGKHAQQSCPTCHKRPEGLVYLFELKGQQICENCHENEHLNQFNPLLARSPCKSCHGGLSFADKVAFDHDKAGFALRDKHASVACDRCHKPTGERFNREPHHPKHQYLLSAGTGLSCANCHIDPHRQRYGTQCERCHGTDSFKKPVDFHRYFVLRGAHLLLSCRQCHQEGSNLTGTGERCQACHRKNDPHRGSLPDCKQCHRQSGWEQVQFTHTTTGFVLRGAHRTLPCYDCHRSGIYRGLNGDCRTCHLKDAQKVAVPPHRGLAFMDCGRCHNQFSF